MADIFNEDFQDFIESLNRAEVEYLLVGGYAVILHGYQRVTGDMDIWVNKTASNYKKILKALEFFGMPVFDMTEEKFLADTKDYDVFRFGISPTRIDLMTSVLGLDFDECYKSAVINEVEGFPVRVIHLNQLIIAKEASDRDKDRQDIKNLKRIRKL